MSLCGFLGDFAPGAVVRCKFNTTDPKNTGTPLTGGLAKAYKDSSATSEIASGLTLTPNFDTITGLNDVVIDTSADPAFYAAGSEFHIVLTAGIVGGVSVAGLVIASFGILNRTVRDSPGVTTLLTRISAVRAGYLDALANGVPLASENAAALLLAAYEGTENVQDGLRLIRAALVGASDGFGAAGASAGHYKNRAGDKNRLTVAVDEFGNRTKVTTNCY